MILEQVVGNNRNNRAQEELKYEPVMSGAQFVSFLRLEHVFSGFLGLMQSAYGHTPER